MQNNYPSRNSNNYNYYNNNEYIDSNYEINNTIKNINNNNVNNKNYDYEYVLNDDPFKPTNGRYVYKNNSNSKLPENSPQFNFSSNNINKYNEINANYQPNNNLNNSNFSSDRRSFIINTTISNSKYCIILRYQTEI